MTIIGFTFTKMVAQKNDVHAEKINVQNNIGVLQVQEKSITIGSTQNATLVVTYTYDLTYQPALGSIKIEGEITFMLPTAQVATIVKEFKEKKSIPAQLMEQVIKTVFAKCQIQSIVLARDLNLPSPVPLPKLQVNKQQATTQKAPAKNK
jgi:hypothetical protein